MCKPILLILMINLSKNLNFCNCKNGLNNTTSQSRVLTIKRWLLLPSAQTARGKSWLMKAVISTVILLFQWLNLNYYDQLNVCNEVLWLHMFFMVPTLYNQPFTVSFTVYKHKKFKWGLKLLLIHGIIRVIIIMPVGSDKLAF